MTSGVYKLTFRSGKDYIGKSINIDNRYKDHLKAFESRKASAKMQEEYDKWGVPELSIILETHPDHIDILESHLIGFLRPELNTQVPLGLPKSDLEYILDHRDFLKYSTVNLIRYCIEKDNQYDKLLMQYEELEANNAVVEDMYNRKLYETEAYQKLKVVETRLNQAIAELAEARRPKSWFSKLFG